MRFDTNCWSPRLVSSLDVEEEEEQLQRKRIYAYIHKPQGQKRSFYYFEEEDYTSIKFSSPGGELSQECTLFQFAFTENVPVHERSLFIGDLKSGFTPMIK